jgi:zinc transporter ZupT
LTKAWSLRLIILAAMLSGFEVALPIIRESLEPLQIVPPGVFAGLSFVATAAAGIARLMAQPKSLP